MDDSSDFRRETPRFCIAFSLFSAALAVAVVMSVILTVKAHAQQPPQNLCAPLSQIVPAWRETHKEQIVWEGVSPTPNGPIELVLFQSSTGSWTLFIVQQGIACMRAAGNGGTEIQTGKGV
jgi:hypothetical protein